MAAILDYIQSNFLALAGIVISFVSIVLAVRYKSKKQLRLYYHTNKVYIGGGGIAKDLLRITYDGESVDKMYKTSFYFWCSGNKTINVSDIVDKLEIKIPNTGKFLYTMLVKQSREGCKIDLNETSKNSLHVTFDFLDPKDGAYIEMLHTDSLEPTYWLIKGTKLKLLRDINCSEQVQRKHYVDLIMLIFTGLLSLVIGWVFMDVALDQFSKGAWLIFPAVLLMCMSLGVVGGYFFILLPKVFRNRLPKSLRT